jgi:hypothetical protein
MPGRSIAHAEGGERKFANESQWNIINTKRKQQNGNEKGMKTREKLKLERRVFTVYLHFLLYNQQ